MDVKYGTRTVLLLVSIFLVHCAPEKKNYGFIETSSACSAVADPNRYVVHWASGQTSIVHSPSKKEFINGFLAQHQQNVLWAEHDFRIELPEGDLTLSTMDITGVPDPEWALERIEAPKVWAAGAFGQGINVAVIDTGVDINHFKLRSGIFTNALEVKDGKDNDGNGYIDDLHGYNFVEGSGDMFDDKGHGTHVAGIIASDHNLGFSRGVAPQSKIIPLRTISSEGFGSAAMAAKAIHYAVQLGAHVINASWGGPNCSETLYSAIESLAARDVLFVAAAGNNRVSLDQVGVFPAGFQLGHQLTVGSSGTSDLMSSFSNYSASKVHLLAPGYFIWSSLPGNREGPEDGTSMAAPFVSGAAALLKSAFPSASMHSIRQALLEGVDSPPVISGRQVSYPVSSGGRLNVWRSYQLLASPRLK